MKKIVFAATALLSYAAAFAGDEAVIATDDAAYDGAASCECAFDSVYLGLGIGGSFLKVKAEPAPAHGDGKSNRFIGTVFVGAGKTFKKKFYVGPELMLDFTKNKTHGDYSNTGDGTRHNGVAPQFGLRIGGIVKNSWLVYLKVAGVHSKASGKFSGTELSCSKVSPALALGVEKAFCKKFSARLEGEYVFNANKTSKVNDTDCKIKNEGGFNIRALVAYNIKY
ncbi:MAG: porin family protein [Holosporaceae bacterium]|jgi:hypothetical protein|nr:porin family protein [Holosporaceae bacterium]